MAEPEQVQMTVTVSQDADGVTVELNPDDLINLRPDDTIDKVTVTMAGERIAELQRFHGLPPGINPADLN